MSARKSPAPSKARTSAKTRTRRKADRAPKAAAKRAESAAQAAKAAGAVSRSGKGLTMAQRRLRDSAIVARLAAGWTQEMVAEEFGLTDRQVRRIASETQATLTALDKRPMQVLEDLLRGYERAVVDFEAMAHEWAAAHPNAAMGAKRAALDTRVAVAELLMRLGKLPRNLELFRSEAQMLRIAEEMVGKLEDLARGDASADDVLVFFRALLPDQPRELTA